MSLEKIFNAKSIAIIGASNQKDSVGNALYMNALNSKVNRRIYPVNINRKKISGNKTFANVKDISSPVDLAVIATPAPTVPLVMEDCAKAGIKSIVIISAGFGEIGAAGQKLSDEVARIAKEHEMRVMGPNCLGFINTRNDLNMSFATKQALPGRTALVSQSGALCTAILDWSIEHNIGFSHFVSIGSMVDVCFSDMIEYLGNSLDTDNIVLYMESLKDPKRFMEVCRKTAKTKRIFVLKSGRSKDGANAAKSHTGSLAGNDNVFDALFKQAGITRLNCIDELYDVISMGESLKSKDRRLAVITNAGGPGVLTTDALCYMGGALAKLGPESIKKLNAKMPASWSKSNPVDIIGDASPQRYRDALEICLEDKNVDSVFVLLTPQAMTNPTDVAKEVVKQAAKSGKFVFTSFMGGDDVREARKILKDGKVSTFSSPERAIKAFVDFTGQKNEIKKIAFLADGKIETEKIKEIFDAVKNDGRKQFTEPEAKKVAECCGLRILKSFVAKTKDQVKEMPLSYPIAMKVVSPDILHKIDSGGVELSIRTLEEAEEAFDRIMASCRKHHPQADIQGVIIEPMICHGLEVIIGLSTDPVIGPIVMFGRGGSEVEIYKDISFGVLPISQPEIHGMIRETKVYARLDGYRNIEGIGIEKIVDIIHRVTLLHESFPEIKELDINPLLIAKGKGVALDVKIVIN